MADWEIKDVENVKVLMSKFHVYYVSTLSKYQCFGSVSADRLPGWWIRIRFRFWTIFQFFSLLNKINYFFKKKLYFYSFGWFVCEFITIFFWYPDPDQRFLMRIRIRPNDTDPTGSGSETLLNIYVYLTELLPFPFWAGWKVVLRSNSIAGIRRYKYWPTNYRRFVLQEFYSFDRKLKYRYANKVQTAHSHNKTKSFIVLCC